jgi:HlyD family secretion protein
MANDRLQRLKSGAIEETRKLFWIFLYLWVLFSLFSFHKALVLKEEYLIYDQWFALINALVLAKVVLIGEFFNLGDNFKNRPLIYPILFKSAVFAALLICFHIIEQAFRGLLGGMTFSQSISSIGGGKLQGILMLGIIMFVVLMPFFAFRELDRAIGAIEFHTLLFGDETRARAGLPISMRRAWPLAAAGALGAALGGGWLIWSLNRGPAAHYVTQKLERGSVVRTVTASGVVGAVPSVPVFALVSGVIQKVECEANMKVKAGQFCAKIDPRPYQIMVDQAKSDLAVAEARFDKNKEDLARAKAAFEHFEALAKRRAVVQKAIIKSRKSYEQAQAQAKLDEETVAHLQAALRAAEANLAYTDVIAPAAGTVVSLNVGIGQNVAVGSEAPPLFLIKTGPSVMQVNAKVGENDISDVKLGDKASFSVQSTPNEVYRGEVIQIGQSPQTIQNITTYDVVISAPNPRLSLQPGMAATITVMVDRRDNVLRAPDQALRYSPGGHKADPITQPDGSSRLWVLRAGKPTAIPAQLGLDDGVYIEISKGDLQPGDELIIGERGSD